MRLIKEVPGDFPVFSQWTLGWMIIRWGTLHCQTEIAQNSIDQSKSLDNFGQFIYLSSNRLSQIQISIYVQKII